MHDSESGSDYGERGEQGESGGGYEGESGESGGYEGESGGSEQEGASGGYQGESSMIWPPVFGILLGVCFYSFLFALAALFLKRERA